MVHFLVHIEDENSFTEIIKIELSEKYFSFAAMCWDLSPTSTVL